MTSMARPLSALKENEKGKIAGIEGGREITRRLTHMGFDPGTEVRMVKNEGRGPVIVELRGSGRIALGRGMAEKIFLEETG